MRIHLRYCASNNIVSPISSVYSQYPEKSISSQTPQVMFISPCISVQAYVSTTPISDSPRERGGYREYLMSYIKGIKSRPDTPSKD